MIESYNCYFCKQLIDVTQSLGTAHCANCDAEHVFSWKNSKLVCCNFEITINSRTYAVWLYCDDNKTEICEIETSNWNEIDIIQLEGFPLTPSNVMAKLPIYILFS